MRISGINTFDVVNGQGVRISMFVSGCRHHCKGCFNPETWDFNYGEKFTENIQDGIIKVLHRPEFAGLSILGGEPMEPENQKDILSLTEEVKGNTLGKNIWLYSGYTWEQLMDPEHHCHTEYTEKILENVDVLVDGEFHIDEKDASLEFRGSRNQRILDVKKSLEAGEPVLYDLKCKEVF